MNFRFRHPVFVSCFVLAALVFGLYSISLGHNFLFDEDDIILLNPLMRELKLIPKLFEHGFFQKAAGVEEIWEQYYRPVTAATFVLDYSVWKANPMGYNLTNTALFCLVVFALQAFLYKIFGDRRIAFLASALFAVHTIHTEAVTYIASRGDLLGGLLTLCIFLLYWNGRLAAAIGVYFISLFCKESTLVLPVYLAVLDFTFLRTPWKRLAARLAPYVAVGAAYVYFRKVYSPVPMGPPTFDWSDAMLRLFSMGHPLLDYFRALLNPFPFQFCAEIAWAKSFADPRIAVTIAVFALLAAAWALTVRYRGAAFFGMTLFLLSLGPTLQIIHFFPEWAEHYLFVPSMGLIILFGALLREVLAKGKSAAIALMALYLPFTGFIAWRTAERNSYYVDTETYYNALATSESPYAYYGYINLGIQAVLKESWDKAAVPLLTAYSIDPETESNNYNLGLYYFSQKRYDRAAELFRKAYDTEYGHHQPVNLLCLGMTYTRMGRFDDAIKVLEQAHEKLPKTASVYKNLIRVNGLSGRPEEAVRWTEKGLREISAKDQKIDHAAVLMEAVLLSYVNGWDEKGEAYLAELADTHAETPWYGDAARFLRGETTLDEYEEIVEKKYPYNAKDARLLHLISHVRNARWDLVKRFLEDNRVMIERADDPLIIRKLFARAESSLSTVPTPVS